MPKRALGGKQNVRADSGGTVTRHDAPMQESDVKQPQLAAAIRIVEQQGHLPPQFVFSGVERPLNLRAEARGERHTFDATQQPAGALSLRGLLLDTGARLPILGGEQG